ncbi:MAG: ribonuclease domain-containing protein [Nocardioides sp.]
MTQQRIVAGFLAVAMGLGALWWVGSVVVDPPAEMATVALADLPAEAAETLALIEVGGPFPFDEDGGTFGNFEGLLPDRERGYYKEYTVVTPGSVDRGARRIVVGSDGDLYWTENHYQSFERIVK